MDLKFRCNECCSFFIFGRPLIYISMLLRELCLCSSFGVWCLVWPVYSRQMKMMNGSGFVSLFLCCHVSCLVESFVRVSSLLSCVLFLALCPLLPSASLVETGCGFYCCGHVGPLVRLSGAISAALVSTGSESGDPVDGFSVLCILVLQLFILCFVSWSCFFVSTMSES